MKKKKKRSLKIIFLYYAIAVILLMYGITFSQYRTTASGEARIIKCKFRTFGYFNR